MLLRSLHPLVLAAALASTPASADSGLSFHTDENLGVDVKVPALYPEGIEHDPTTGAFLLGSIRKGQVVRVHDDGRAEVLVEDERLRSVVGIRVDPERGRLLVNNADYGASERSTPADRFATAALAIYDLETGAPLQYVDLSALRADEQRFVNDLTIDKDGNAFVTDSLAAAIYRVTPEGEASVFLTDERFRGEGFNLNGIQAHENGYLLVAKKSDGSLFRVPLDAPETFTEVTLPQPLVGTDGLVLTAADELIAITNRAAGQAPNTVHRLVSQDGWSSAEIVESVATGDVYTTTGTLRDGRLFVSQGHLHTLDDALKDPNQPLRESFRIREIGAKP
ncbi:MAG: hypothetical protein ACFB6S_18800 [Geminicoccaceae bacterium]